MLNNPTFYELRSDRTSKSQTTSLRTQPPTACDVHHIQTTLPSVLDITTSGWEEREGVMKGEEVITPVTEARQLLQPRWTL